MSELFRQGSIAGGHEVQQLSEIVSLREVDLMEHQEALQKLFSCLLRVKGDGLTITVALAC